jgi:hypothetical protein
VPHVFDWPIIMIDPGGLLLVVPTYLQSPFSVLRVALEKSKQLNLDVRNFFVGSHIEPQWGCSKGPTVFCPIKLHLRIGLAHA